MIYCWKRLLNLKKKIKKLTGLNEFTQYFLNIFKTSIRNAQKDVENFKEDYNILQMKNKDLLFELQNIDILTKSNDVDHSEELATKNENNFSSSSCLSSEGLLVISD